MDDLLSNASASFMVPVDGEVDLTGFTIGALTQERPQIVATTPMNASSGNALLTTVRLTCSKPIDLESLGAVYENGKLKSFGENFYLLSGDKPLKGEKHTACFGNISLDGDGTEIVMELKSKEDVLPKFKFISVFVEGEVKDTDGIPFFDRYSFYFKTGDEKDSEPPVIYINDETRSVNGRMITVQDWLKNVENSKNRTTDKFNLNFRIEDNYSISKYKITETLFVKSDGTRVSGYQADGSYTSGSAHTKTVTKNEIHNSVVTYDSVWSFNDNEQNIEDGLYEICIEAEDEFGKTCTEKFYIIRDTAKIETADLFTLNPSDEVNIKTVGYSTGYVDFIGNSKKSAMKFSVDKTKFPKTVIAAADGTSVSDTGTVSFINYDNVKYYYAVTESETVNESDWKEISYDETLEIDFLPLCNGKDKTFYLHRKISDDVGRDTEEYKMYTVDVTGPVIGEWTKWIKAYEHPESHNMIVFRTTVGGTSSFVFLSDTTAQPSNSSSYKLLIDGEVKKLAKIKSTSTLYSLPAIGENAKCKVKFVFWDKVGNESELEFDYWGDGLKWFDDE
ncbi:MAG: hypothetical protein HUK25_06675 [Treponema sp.]|nr:hypothetical protein [Treponema sp.]